MLDRYDYVEKIFNDDIYRVRTTYMTVMETYESMSDTGTLDQGEDIAHHFGSTGVLLDPSGGFFVSSDDEEHDSLLQAAIRRDPVKLATEEFDKLGMYVEDAYELTLNQIVELFELHRSLTLVEPKDCFLIYRTLHGYLESLEKDEFMSMNSSPIPDEDIVKMKNLCESLKPLISYFEASDVELDTGNPFKGYAKSIPTASNVTMSSTGEATVSNLSSVKASAKGQNTLPKSIRDYM